MTDKESTVLVCSKCARAYPAGTALCSEDQGELVAQVNDPLIGSIFADKYEIISVIGEGGMSRVYKARHTLMKRIVAVKLLHEEATDDPAAKARFQLEAEAASALSHPNVITVHDFGLTPSGQAYFIMDCLIGRGLDEILQECGSLPLEQALDVFTQACDGLDHAHRKNIIHRDIKPSNLVIVKQEDASDLVKLVDFGIAKIVRTDKPKQQQLTHTGEIFGTPIYMSPEQCNGRTLDARSDIYSFGCLMYETLSGEPPLVGDNFINTVVKQINELPKPLSDSAPHRKVPPSIEAVIMKCLQKNPADRFSTAAELRQALFDAAYEAGLKGLRVGAIPELKVTSKQSAESSQKMIKLQEESNKNKRLQLVILGSFAGIVLSVSAWFFFIDSGTSGDGGTIWQQIVWQAGILQAESLVRDKKYGEAQRVLEDCYQQAQQFNDDSWRELTLNRLVEAADANHDFVAQKVANDRLSAMGDAKVFKEYELLMKMLKDWQGSSANEVEEMERQQRAVAFGERISKLSDELAKRSLQKQEALLDRSIEVFESMNLKGSRQNIRFRFALADSYRNQQRIKDMIALLKETLPLCPDSPKALPDLQMKVRMLLLLGHGERLLATDRDDLDLAGKHLETALTLTKESVPVDPLLLRDCTNALSVLYHQYHTPEHESKAAALDKLRSTLPLKSEHSN